MKFCPKCGNSLKEVKKFCPKCGADISQRIKKFKNKNYVFLIIISIVIILIFLGVSSRKNNVADFSFSDIRSYIPPINKQDFIPKYCGDGLCNGEETCKNCIKDCGDCRELVYQEGEYCGDNICSLGECSIRCTLDCSINDCIDGICDPGLGENCDNSPDCACSGPTKCEKKQCITYCGNGICEENEKNCDMNHCIADCGVCTCEYLGGNICNKKELCSLNYFNNKAKDTDRCCLGNCEDNPHYYPIIFVHGHSLSQDESKDSINAFTEFQQKLSNEEGYTNKGYLLFGVCDNMQVNSWNYDKPITIRTTYYRDSTNNDLSQPIGDGDNKRINDYALILKNVADCVMYLTDSKKVKIIAHSMGGLVTRGYIKNYGGDQYVDKVVLIGTPNHGINGLIKDFCDGVNQDRPECQEMQAGSSFLNSLNSEDETYGNVKYMTIRGTLYDDTSVEIVKPCGYDTHEHDETVCETSVPLEGSQNEVVKYGRVTGTGTLHSELKFPSKVPEVYSKTKNFITK